MRVIVLGASGQIGRVLFEELGKSIEVVGTSRSGSMGLQKFDPFVDSWSLLGKADVIINCVGQIEATKNYSFHKIHVGLTKLIIDNREIIGNPRIIQISALGATTDQEVEFLRTKGEADTYLLGFDNTVCVRPSIVCTHDTMLVKRMQKLYEISRMGLGLLIVPKGMFDKRIQPIMPDDLSAIVKGLCIEKEIPKIVNAVGPEAFSFGDIIKIMMLQRRASFKVIQVPKFLSDMAIGMVSKLFPDIISQQQYKLIFYDNISDPTQAEKYTTLTSTKNFWKTEF
jgi:uncharacterized protein YbjT (DUF2867 family)